MVDGRRELAGGEGVEGAEAGVEFGGGDAALAVEPAEKMGGGTLAFERIAFEAGGNQVAIGVAPRPGTGHDVVEALDARVGAAQTIKTMAAFAEVDGLAEGAGLEEVEVFQIGGLRRAGGAADGDGARTSTSRALMAAMTGINFLISRSCLVPINLATTRSSIWAASMNGFAVS